MNNIRQLPPFMGFLASTPVIPNLYWDVYSSEQRWKEICKWLGSLADYAEKANVNIGVNSDAIEKLEQEFETFKESGFLDYYEQQLEKWLNKNAEKTIKSMLGIGLFFGLTSDGYFCAYVPETWSEIQFDTGAAYGANSYGRLILRYEVEGQGVIDNSDYDTDALNRIIGEALKHAAGDNLLYSEASGQLSVPTADAVTPGVVKIAHKISNDSTDGVAASPDAVYAFAQPRG